MFKTIQIAVIVISVLTFSCNSPKKKTPKEKKAISFPNVVYILADDMGYGDISALNPESGIPTPNMDNIIKNGISFTDAHSNSSVCTPTRYGILTGRYAWKTRLKKGVLWGYSEPLIEKERITVASFLKDHGYNTACIGKWHLGLGWQLKDSTLPIVKTQWQKTLPKGEHSNVDYTKPASGPNDLGFGYSYIIPASLDMTPYVYLENDLPTALPVAYTEGRSEVKDGRGVTWRAGEMVENFDFNNVLSHITKKATTYISEQSESEKPFFLYFPLTAPHTPWMPSNEVLGKSKAGRYGDFVTMVDHTVGEVVRVLKKTGQLSNTLIIVTSDNGAHWREEDKAQFVHRANDVYRGQKADIYEGGHHIPYIAQWPEKIKAGSTSRQLICTTDLLATLSGIINKPLPENAGEDSYNLWPAYINQDKEPIRDYTIHHSLIGYFSIRKGKWKLTPHLGSGGFSKPKNNDSKEIGFEGTLYNMEKDPEETTNLYNTELKVREELIEALKKAQEYSNTNDLIL